VIDLDYLKELSQEIDRPIRTLLALGFDNDPFYADLPSRRAGAEWFAALWERFGFREGVHLRRIHYVLISQDPPITNHRSVDYTNTVNCWTDLKEAAKDARYLGLVPIESFVDRRSDEAVVFLERREQAAMLGVWEPSLLSTELPISRLSPWLPEPSDFEFSAAIVDQRYHVELWAEKSTVNDVLLPLGRQYGLNVVAATGDISLTHCHQLIERALASGRPVRILYVSDFDQSGFNMPVAAARKIEFINLNRGLDLDIQVRPVVLTHDQCVEYRLPRTPLKETVRGKDQFQDRFGEGATELDALEALHPGALRDILTEEIERYYDLDLDERVDAVADEFRDRLTDIHSEVVERHQHKLAPIKAKYEALARKINAELDALRKKYQKDFAAVAKQFNSIHGTITEELREERPDVDEIEWPEPNEGDEDDDPLFDSLRSYVDQIDRFKLHQQKPTERRIRSDFGKRRRAAR
jgi:hypothetical protein